MPQGKFKRFITLASVYVADIYKLILLAKNLPHLSREIHNERNSISNAYIYLAQHEAF
jgi:hypothetical protein